MGIADTSDWEGKYDIEKRHWSGFIAQDVERAAQDLNYDFSGIDYIGGFYSLRSGAFVAPLVKAVQELKAENDRLKAENSSFRTEMNEIKARLEKLEKGK
jgi:hypothetical protein